MRLDHDEKIVPKKAEIVPEKAESKASIELSRKIAASGIQNDAFLLANEDQLVANCKKWAKEYPMIQPYFDVNCNVCPWLLSSLDQEFDFKFSCGNKAEVERVLEQGIDAKKIIFCGENKMSSHVKYAKTNGVPLMTFGSFADLKKIQKASSVQNLGLLLALQNPTGNPEVDRQWLDLLNAAKEMGINVSGVAFNQVSISKMLALAKMAFTIGRSLGHQMTIIDIGLMSQASLDKDMIEKALSGLEGHQLVGHLGAEFVEDVFTVGAKVIGKRSAKTFNNSIIINDGIFNSFQRLMTDENYELENVVALKGQEKNDKEILFDIFGSSGDDMDILVQDYLLDLDVQEDDWLFFPKMGAFSYGLQANMISIKLPSKFGNFRLFSPDALPLAREDSVNLEESGLNVENVLISEDGLEVIFLDIQGNNAEQQTCLDLFEELPSLTSFSKFWEEFYSDLR